MAYIVINLFVDLLYSVIDPRIRVSGGGLTRSPMSYVERCGRARAARARGGGGSCASASCAGRPP